MITAYHGKLVIMEKKQLYLWKQGDINVMIMWCLIHDDS